MTLIIPAGVPVGRITGVHRQANQLLAQVRDVKAFYGIQEQCLETLLKADALL